MKKLLLSAAFLMSLCASAQDPIYRFYGNLSIIPEEGPDINHYVLVTSDSPLDQTASGPNMAWNFNDLSVVTQTTTTVNIPSPQVLADYPGTTLVVETTTEGGNPTHYYLAEGQGGQTSLTGAETSQMTIKYNDFALVGYFPMDYEDSATSNVSGTFDGQGFEGTFTGSASSIVDAYGTLTVNEGFEGTKNVTRLRTQQDLTLNYMGFPVGTLNQTTYSYYSADLISGPVFRSITTHINVPALSIDQTRSTLESYVQTTNATADFNANAKVAIAPNPVKDMLHIAGNDGIESVTIIDAAGRAILNAKGNDVPVSHLPAGVYQVMIGSQSGSQSLKMVKL